MPKSSANPTVKKPTLAREITLTLILKFALIYVIWWWFFSNPIDEHLDDTQVQSVIFGELPAALPTATPNRKPTETP